MGHTISNLGPLERASQHKGWRNMHESLELETQTALPWRPSVSSLGGWVAEVVDLTTVSQTVLVIGVIVEWLEQYRNGGEQLNNQWLFWLPYHGRILGHSLARKEARLGVQHWGGGSLAKVLGPQVWRPEFRPSETHISTGWLWQLAYSGSLSKLDSKTVYRDGLWP